MYDSQTALIGNYINPIIGDMKVQDITPRVVDKYIQTLQKTPAVSTRTRHAKEKPAACICAEKCQAGAVNTACPVCAVNMSECAGKAPEMELEPKPEPEKESGSGGALVLVLLLAALGGGGAFAYIKFIKPKQGAKVSADPDDYEFEDEEYENEDASEQEEIEEK